MEQEQRREPRYQVVLDGSVRNGTGNQRGVQITNLSRQGCRFRLSEQALQPGGFLTIKVGKLGFLDAHIAWREDGWVGVRFDQPLHPAVLDHLRLFLSEEPALEPERQDFSGDDPSSAGDEA